MITTHEALDAVDNRISYRQVDYWLRTRRITLAAAVAGSGNHRVWSPVEVAALADFVDAYETHAEMTRLLADGSVWLSCLKNQRPHLVTDAGQ